MSSRTLIFEPNIVSVGSGTRKTIFDERLAYQLEDLTTVENTLQPQESIEAVAQQVLVVYATSDVELKVTRNNVEVILVGRFHILSGPGDYTITNQGSTETSAKLIFG